ncbi:hypothetical protein [Nonomuraea sp. NEAU-A123]|uniref:hypothetical protein n=1 Tax=Nonomuraea sp. NEAU-A123 TaxID=2839649 RepID=UPI001BE44560|nr:hypothetical protein [Nonomuraea sp. NEAU-A123]MBT2233548.1 hypothetical protein [Nonomuraea sp. NEAU-A123]
MLAKDRGCRASGRGRDGRTRRCSGKIAGTACNAAGSPACRLGRPEGKQITLGLAKLSAQDAATRKGTLVFNLGSPAQQILVLRQAKITFADLRSGINVICAP